MNRKHAPRPAISIAVALIAAAALAACGSSSSPQSSTSSSSSGSAASAATGRAELAACLKQHGVTLPTRPSGAKPPSGGYGPGGGGFFGGGGGGGARPRRWRRRPKRQQRAGDEVPGRDEGVRRELRRRTAWCRSARWRRREAERRGACELQLLRRRARLQAAQAQHLGQRPDLPAQDRVEQDVRGRGQGVRVAPATERRGFGLRRVQRVAAASRLALSARSSRGPSSPERR